MRTLNTLKNLIKFLKRNYFKKNIDKRHNISYYIGIIDL